MLYKNIVNKSIRALECIGVGDSILIAKVRGRGIRYIIDVGQKTLIEREKLRTTFTSSMSQIQMRLKCIWGHQRGIGCLKGQALIQAVFYPKQSNREPLCEGKGVCYGSNSLVQLRYTCTCGIMPLVVLLERYKGDCICSSRRLKHKEQCKEG